MHPLREGYRIEQRWHTITTGYWNVDGVFCIIDENGLAYPLATSTRPLDMDAIVDRMAGRTASEMGWVGDRHLTRRSPPGTDEETWLRENDTRHPQYQGL
jgi:hypothetical protein